jgi:PEP-CTERM motif
MTDLSSTSGPIRKDRLLHVAALVIGGGLASMVMGQTASADTLHGYCWGTGNTCTDNGTNTPESLNPPQFGFHGSGGTDTGDFWIVFLLPTSVSDPASIGVTGAVAGTASLVSTIPFTSGQLDTYLGISASPANPIGAFAAGGSSFEVFKFDLGTQTITGTAGPQESTSISLPTDSYIVAFLNTGNATAPDWSATANSGAIFETGPPRSVIPEPTSLILLGTGVLGTAGTIRRRLRTHRS